MHTQKIIIQTYTHTHIHGQQSLLTFGPAKSLQPANLLRDMHNAQVICQRPIARAGEMDSSLHICCQHPEQFKLKDVGIRVVPRSPHGCYLPRLHSAVASKVAPWPAALARDKDTIFQVKGSNLATKVSGLISHLDLRLLREAAGKPASLFDFQPPNSHLIMCQGLWNS